MLSKELEYSLNQVYMLAREQRHEYLTLEHLLLALLDHLTVVEVLEACGASVDLLSRELQQFIEENTPTIPPEISDEMLAEDTTNVDKDNPEANLVQPTVSFQRALQRAIAHVQSSGKEEVAPINVLVAIFAESESYAVYLLDKYDVTRVDVIQYITHGIGREESDDDEEYEGEALLNDESEGEDSRETALEKYATNLNESAKAEEIDPLIGRATEVERCVQILCRRRKNNPLLVGEAGVGKTAIAEGLARLIVENSVPDVLADAVVWSLDLGALLAGTKYRGDFEKRLKAVLKELKSQPHAVLFIDEIHTLIGAGAASGGVMDASNLLKPMLGSGKLRCIGATTWNEYRGVFEKDRALARRFQKIEVEEPSVEDTVKILRGLKSRFEEHHDIRYTDGALKAAAELSEKYINDRHLPDKAIDVVDEAGANMRLRPESRRRKTITASDVESVIAKIARIPPKSVSRDDKRVLKNLERDLKLVIFGQDDAVGQVSTAIKLARSGLRSGDKPIGSFLFAGPTGVGKTELTKQLAKFLGIELLRFDMSEYMERHTVSRLIGAPPGYVGYDQGGLLTDAVLKNPHAVVLLDEIEKAHPEVFNLLLQVMDHGTLTDNNGRKADFRNVIFIMTTNSGAQEVQRRSIGLVEQDNSRDNMEAINRQFTPEFRNRLDAIVQFAPLGKRTIANVVDKLLIELEAQLEARNITLEIKTSARKWLGDNGVDEMMGARPMARLIQDKIKKPLAEHMLFGELVNGGVVTVSTKGGELDIQTKAHKAKGKEEAAEAE
ncbi:MAG: ATP-dependent Clp protease ATP-binding subunit ClpA [Gammaproteobacteria bacterium]|nr:ATP-dependent Clp protease ATP-binding subunit ClpA [Gammaproteobacteria bacterium]